jgi:hypothetical protein
VHKPQMRNGARVVLVRWIYLMRGWSTTLARCLYFAPGLPLLGTRPSRRARGNLLPGKVRELGCGQHPPHAMALVAHHCNAVTASTLTRSLAFPDALFIRPQHCLPWRST